MTKATAVDALNDALGLSENSGAEHEEHDDGEEGQHVEEGAGEHLEDGGEGGEPSAGEVGQRVFRDRPRLLPQRGVWEARR